MLRKKLGAAGNVYQQKGREGYVIRWIDWQGVRRLRSLNTAALRYDHRQDYLLTTRLHCGACTGDPPR